MPKYPDDYYLTHQEIDDLRSDAKQASKVATGLFYDAIPFSEVESMHQKISKINPLDRK
ncbi:hypothetical protein F994_00013 [Acinetobacter bohemicus ANC 3994]|uniref:Uncharacterized protein n=1 Tax=Acinetobacter bohemicus ANC 3994 TaxID=1217715 RepID=N8P4D7_9GAMM|nr:hypothetical protein [Acinetobacter bohemicus]ENU21446.1 hypothetical protein F994_00013 [Acinetobacter bohemicus ANC 3994]